MNYTNKLGAFAGSFSPPHKGHFDVVKRAIEEIKPDSFTIFVSSGTRDGITQDDSIKIWKIYGKYLNSNINVVKGSSIRDIYDYSKNNLDSEVYFVIGYREENEQDLKDLERRTKFNQEKYPNLRILKVSTGDKLKNISGTYSRSVSNDYDKFRETLPEELNDDEVNEIHSLISSKNINEGLNHPENMDYKSHIEGLTIYALNNNYNITPLPKVIFKHNDLTNGDNFLGKTAYYNPNDSSIVIYTFGRDPISIVNDFSRNLIIHQQNIEGKFKRDNINENFESNKYNQNINIEEIINQLEEYINNNGYPLENKPKIKYIHGDVENAKNFYGKTAYYDPESKEIVLYTEGRHPRDLINSYTHERIHAYQDKKGELDGINTTNVLESDELEKLEREAYENGGFMLRSFKDFMKNR